MLVARLSLATDNGSESTPFVCVCVFFFFFTSRLPQECETYQNVSI